MDIKIVNEESLMIEFEDEISIETNYKVRAYAEYFKNKEGILSIIPSYRSLLLYFDFNSLNHTVLIDEIHRVNINQKLKNMDKNIVKIPVCYELGLDLKRVEEHTSLSKDDIIRIHSSTIYPVYMIGFMPGFPYLGGMDSKLYTKRLDTPRTKIEKGSVGIGGKQTGIYPFASPGGWNIIGRTPVKLFEETSLLKMGDYIKFYPISEEEYKRMIDGRN